MLRKTLPGEITAIKALISNNTTDPSQKEVAYAFAQINPKSNNGLSYQNYDDWVSQNQGKYAVEYK